MTQGELTMKEAVTMSGKSEATLRRLIGTREVVAKKDPDGRYVIAEDSLRRYLATKALPTPPIAGASRHGPTTRSRDEGDDGRVVEALKAHIAHLERSLERETRRADAAERSRDDAAMERRQTTAEMHALLKKHAQDGLLSRWVRTKSL